MKITKEISKWDVWNNGAIEMADAALATNGLGEHFHDHWTFGFILQGQCLFESGGHKHLAPEGSLFIIPPLEVHTSGANVKYRALYVHDVIVNAHAPALRVFMLSNRKRVWVDGSPLIQELCNAIETGSAFDSAWASLLHQINSPTPCPKRHPAQPELQEIINRSWDKNLDIAALESSTNQSRWQAIRNFKKTVGITPGAYLRQLRVLKSRHMLTQGGALAEIAQDLNFSDQAHYTRAFKQVFGISPGAFKRKIAFRNKDIR